MNTITIKDYLSGAATEKEVADYAISKLIEQGRQSLNNDGACVYRAEDGGKCAVGHLIPDEDYVPWMDDRCTGIEDVVNKHFLKNRNVPIIMDNRIQFLSSIQVLHDDASIGDIDDMGRDEKFVSTLKSSAKQYYILRGWDFQF